LTRTTKDLPADSCPAFSPDGRTLAFSRWVDLGICDSYLLNLSRDLKPVGEPRRLTFQGLPFAGSAWMSDGSALIYSAGGNLWKVALSGSSQPQKLASFGQSAYSPAISHRASRLAFTHSTSDTNIWRIEISPSQGKPSPPTKFISSTRNEWNPQYSPDGKKISFTSDRSGSEELWSCDTEGSNAIQLTHFGKGFVDEPRFSPDSSRLAFYSSAEGHSEIYVVSASGGKPRRLTFSVGSTDPGWSADGQWIYFSSVDTFLIYKMPAEGGPAEPVNSGLYGWDATESVDGKSIYFIEKKATGDLWRTTARGDEPRKVLNSIYSTIICTFEDDGIYFIPQAGPDKGYSIRFYESATGKIKTVAELGTQAESLTVSPDRRWALYTQQDQAGSDLMLVENFR